MNTNAYAPRRLGRAGPTVFPLALGAMGMSPMYGTPDDDESIATLHAALDRGVDLIDTGDFYGSGHNEALIGRALCGRRERVLLSVKFGALRDPAGGWTGIDCRPVALKNYLAYSLQRLGVDHVDIYRPARLDPQVPIEDVVGAIADLIKAGTVRYVGLSEVGADTIRRAHAVHPIADVQLEYSLLSRGIERSILPTVEELGIGLTAYGALSRGLLAGSTPKGGNDFRAHLPRFTGDNLAANRRLVAALESIARARGATTAQLAIAWVLSRGANIVPVIGARKRSQLEESLAALNLTLSAGDLAAIEAAVPPQAVAGTRYDARQMAMLDSERASTATSA
ncbi:aldo/keto reductase [Betaproteobacteria bacterium PRO7]|jgi:aryl-alcohol dehydrogenase-like predicted oxidoreductase|nr:aldo/keto reductase [Betaproteobacteria bacterium PRO7]